MEESEDDIIIASHSPASLKAVATNGIVQQLVENCLPKNLFKEKERTQEHSIQDIISSQDSYCHICHLNCRKKLIENIKCLLDWWNSNDGIGLLPLHLQRDVRKAVGSLLEITENICLIYRLILQIAFATSAGGDLPRHMKVIGNTVVNISKFSDGFNEVLDGLAPFDFLEELDTRLFECDHSLEVVKILKNANNLKALHIHSRALLSSEMFMHIEKYCLNLETLTIGHGFSWHIVGDNLYKAFFRGIGLDDVLKKLHDVDAINSIMKTFMSLKHVNLDLFSVTGPHAEKFLQILLHFYPNLHSVANVRSGGINASLLVPAIDNIFDGVTRSQCKLKALNLHKFSTDLDGINKILALCPDVEHISLDDRFENDSSQSLWQQAYQYGENLKDIAIKFNVSSLTLKIFMMNNTFLPTMSAIGHSITCLSLELYCSGDADMLCRIINHSKNLNSLKVVMHFGSFTNDCSKRVNDLTSLKELLIWQYITYGVSVQNFQLFVRHLLESSPNIMKLNINILDSKIVMDLSDAGSLRNIETLGLIGEVYTNPNIEADEIIQIIQVVESLPSLKKLVLYISPKDLKFCKTLYRKNALIVVDGSTVMGNPSQFD